MENQLNDNPDNALIQRLYGDLFDEIQPDRRRHRVYFHGGRGIGKTTVLRLLAGEAAEQFESPTEIISGKLWDEASERIEALEAKARRGSLLPDVYLDDLDHLLRSLLRQTGEPERAGRTLRSLDYLVVKLPGNDRRFWVTSAFSPSRLADVLYQLRGSAVDAVALNDFFSYFFEGHFDVIRLNPWTYNWQRRLEELVYAQLPEGIAQAARTVYGDRVLKLTGGHPALLAGSLHELRRLSTATDLDPLEKSLFEGFAPGAPAALQDLGPLLERHLEDRLAQSALRPLRQSISWLRNTDQQDEEAAYRCLVELARNQDPSTPPLRSREILQDEGLIFKDRGTGTYRVPGSLLQTEILQGAAASGQIREKPTKIQLELRKEDRETAGGIDLIVREGEQTQRIGLAEGPGMILELLFEHPDRYFSVKKLEERTGMNQAAVRSVIQRLARKLREAQLEGLIENAYGQGYRKGRSPTYRGLMLDAVS